MGRDNQWRPVGPTVSPAMARGIDDVRRALTTLVLDQHGHAELLGCLQAAAAAVAECARIAMRDVDRARPTAAAKPRPAPAKRKRRHG